MIKIHEKFLQLNYFNSLNINFSINHIFGDLIIIWIPFH
jgi:hypothetical protein